MAFRHPFDKLFDTSEELKCTCFTPQQKLDLKSALGVLMGAKQSMIVGYGYSNAFETEKQRKEQISHVEHEIQDLRKLHDAIANIPICPESTSIHSYVEERHLVRR